MKTQKDIRAFWDWFAANADLLKVANENSPEIEILDQKLTDLNPDLSWEIGPGQDKIWQFVVSPNLDPKLLNETRKLVALAPLLTDWEFHSSRQVKDWDYRFELSNEDGTDSVAIDASNWSFILLVHPDGDREILLVDENLHLTKDQRWQAAAILLESVLGEETLIANVSTFDLVKKVDSSLKDKVRPIQSLRDSVSMSK